MIAMQPATPSPHRRFPIGHQGPQPGALDATGRWSRPSMRPFHVTARSRAVFARPTGWPRSPAPAAVSPSEVAP